MHPAGPRARGGNAWLIVEPFAADRLEENFAPVGRMSYAASTMSCVTGALAQPRGTTLGAQAARRGCAKSW
jgi:hypothetical protein